MEILFLLHFAMEMRGAQVMSVMEVIISQPIAITDMKLPVLHVSYHFYIIISISSVLSRI